MSQSNPGKSETPRITRREKAEQTRLLVFSTALSLLEGKAFEQITIRDIVQAAGVSVGTFYKYFQSKLDVYYETYALADAYFEDTVAPMLIQPDVRSRVLLYFDQYAAYSSEHTSLTLTKLLNNSSNTRFLRRSDSGMIPVLRETLQRGIDDKQLDLRESADDLAEYLMVAARGLVYDWCIHDGGYPLRPAMARYVGRLLRCCE